jgi:hypothetical protein
LSRDFYAMSEQRTGDFSPDILTLQWDDAEERSGDERALFSSDDSGGVASMTKADPVVRRSGKIDFEWTTRKQKQIAIRHITKNRLVAIVEIVSPGNKHSRSAVDDFCSKVCSYLEIGVHVSFVDPFASTNRDPGGLHAEIWERLSGERDELTDDEPLSVVAYDAAPRGYRFFLEPFAFGQPCPPMPIFLGTEGNITIPLAETYEFAWQAFPQRLKRRLEA